MDLNTAFVGFGPVLDILYTVYTLMYFMINPRCCKEEDFGSGLG